MSEATFWNGDPCEARKVTVEVADDVVFPLYWARPFVGTRRKAVEVTYDGSTFYLDDDAMADPASAEAKRLYGVEVPGRPAGQGWNKVTVGRGSSGRGHRELVAAPGSVEPRDG